jgi:hypothetical protein
MLNRDALFAIQDLKTVDVFVEEWGDTIRLRMLAATERFEVNDAANVDGKFDPVAFQTKLIEKSAINEDGTPFFLPGDAAAIGAKSAGAVAKVFEAAAKLNGLGVAATDDAEKNS